MTTEIDMPRDGMMQQRGFMMLKEVGASGQISLGKKYAGQLYEVKNTAAHCSLTCVMAPAQ